MKNSYKYISSVIFTLFAFYIFAISSNVVVYYNNVDKNKECYNLHDIWRGIFVDDIDKDANNYIIYYIIVDYIPWTLVFITFFAICYQVYKKKKNFIVRVLFAESILIIANAIAQIITLLPDSDSDKNICNNKNYGVYGSWIFTRLSADSCGDMMWSGHTSHTIFMIIIIYLILMEYDYFKQKKKFKIIYFLFGSVIILFEANSLVFLGTHYSIDVYISLLITPLFLTHPLVLNIN